MRLNDPVDKPRLTRRSLLIAGASGLGVAAFTAGTATGVLPVSEAVQRALEGTQVRKVIVRAPKLVNVVTG